ncbi:MULTISPECIES: hypothetical protein [Streptomyces]|uniref:hypothetical protein n=1 Tax=Streptomyces TaxID=1883 RepID=UPI00114D08DE|nr:MULTISPECIES: hypothetical protein [unclassified Streptomyces]MYT18031.1 hypothetical protein [Streptomyces sp. SID4951]
MAAGNESAGCLVCMPPSVRDWPRDAHLAFEHAPGETWEGDTMVPGLEVRLANARPIFGWGEHSIPADDPLRRARLHRTCRNWQFAWWLRAKRAVPEAEPSAATVDPKGPEQLLLR